MNRFNNRLGLAWNSKILLFALCHVLAIGSIHKSWAAAAPTKTESLDEIYEKAKKEGKLTIYAALSANSIEVIFGAFRKNFPLSPSITST